MPVLHQGIIYCILTSQIMNNKIIFILKVLILSAGLSFLIKYGGPSLSIPSTAINALIAVLLPPILVGILLGWRLLQEVENVE